MAKMKHKSTHKDEGSQEEPAKPVEEVTEHHEEPVEDAAPEVKAAKDVPDETFTFEGHTYKPGDALTVGDVQTTVVEKKIFKASSKSGVSEGEYLVVSVTLQPGNRKAYRAVVGDDLFPIRKYGTAGELISKVRESGGPRKKRKEAPAPQRAEEFSDILLSDEATEILEEYLGFHQNAEGQDVLSDLVVKHLKPEVERLRVTREAVAKLPADLLTLLVNASDEKRRHFMEMLR